MNFECEEIPLADVFAWFRLNLDLEIKPSAAIQLDRAVNIALYHNTIAAALDRLCLRYDLAWKIEQETIVIEIGPLAQSSAELIQLLRTRKSWIACEEEPIELVFGILARNGVEIEFAPDVEVSNVLSIELPSAYVCDLLDSLTEMLDLRWVVYRGVVHIEKAQ